MNNKILDIEVHEANIPEGKIILANGVPQYIGSHVPYSQTTVELFTIIQYIKNHELTSTQLDSLIAELIEYKSTVDNIGEQNYLEEEEIKQFNINS